MDPMPLSSPSRPRGKILIIPTDRHSHHNQQLGMDLEDLSMIGHICHIPLAGTPLFRRRPLEV